MGRVINLKRGRKPHDTVSLRYFTVKHSDQFPLRDVGLDAVNDNFADCWSNCYHIGTLFMYSYLYLKGVCHEILDLQFFS